MDAEVGGELAQGGRVAVDGGEQLLDAMAVSRPELGQRPLPILFPGGPLEEPEAAAQELLDRLDRAHGATSREEPTTSWTMRLPIRCREQTSRTPPSSRATFGIP